MFNIKNIFNKKIKRKDIRVTCHLSPVTQSGGMLTELLLTIALVAIILPFIVRFQTDRVARAENIAAARQMENVSGALERYIGDNRDELLRPSGRNITRVKISDLTEYGLPETLLENGDKKFQLRVLKSADTVGHATLQGVVILSDDTITPLRTREIMNLSDGSLGFVENGRAFGAFGVWRANSADLGTGKSSGIAGTTRASLDADRFLWRTPSDNPDDATMLAPLNLGGHDIVAANNIGARGAEIAEILGAKTIDANQVVFQTRTTIDTDYQTADATVAGALSSDSRALEIANTLTLADTAKFSSVMTNDLWANRLNLSGLTISDTTEDIPTLAVNQTIDMVGGHIDAMTATVGFAGSITPKLEVRGAITDSNDASYYWDATKSSARFNDVILATLVDMAAQAAATEGDAKTSAGQLFGAVAANQNATAADFINALNQIATRVRAKFYKLDLE
jgi:type II secretory pathway pseudopilin PulG